MLSIAWGDITVSESEASGDTTGAVVRLQNTGDERG